MRLFLTVHRGTQAIGGSCIELALDNGERLILDAGRPLDADRAATGLLPKTLDLKRPATVIFSHAHMDHWGLINELPTHWSIHAGEKAALLMRLTTGIFGGTLDRPITTWNSWDGPFRIGGFTIQPYLTDHSAPDAYMLLIEAAGRRVLYTGDFRTHGRKAALVDAMIAQPPPNIDVLLMEGTNLGTAKPVVTERTLENRLATLAAQTAGHVFVNWSAQNVDRTVTLDRAARRTQRSLVIDLYGADVLQQLAPGTGLPCPGPDFPELKVLITPGGKRMYERQGRGEWVNAMARSPFATSRRRLKGGRAIIMARDSMFDDFARHGLHLTGGDSYVFSSWRGYLDVGDQRSGWARAVSVGAKVEHVHTSGHASPADLSRFAAAMDPVALVPVHGVAWDTPEVSLPPMQRLGDGDRWAVPSPSSLT